VFKISHEGILLENNLTFRKGPRIRLAEISQGKVEGEEGHGGEVIRWNQGGQKGGSPADSITGGGGEGKRKGAAVLM